jgi:hypothetical protein
MSAATASTPGSNTPAPTPAPLPATTENLLFAQAFALTCWREYVFEVARIRRREYVEPADLTNACRFAAVFAQRVFGGQLRGNYFHVWCETADGQRVDLTDAVQFADGVPAAWRARARKVGLNILDPGEHDPRVWREREFCDAMASVEFVAERWADAFLAAHRALPAA